MWLIKDEVQTGVKLRGLFCVLCVSVGEAKSTLDRRSALHLFRLGEAMLRIVRNKNRPLLHMMRAWSVVAPHLVEVGYYYLLNSVLFLSSLLLLTSQPLSCTIV